MKKKGAKQTNAAVSDQDSIDLHSLSNYQKIAKLVLLKTSLQEKNGENILKAVRELSFCSFCLLMDE